MSCTAQGCNLTIARLPEVSEYCIMSARGDCGHIIRNIPHKERGDCGIIQTYYVTLICVAIIT